MMHSLIDLRLRHTWQLYGPRRLKTIACHWAIIGGCVTKMARHPATGHYRF